MTARTADAQGSPRMLNELDRRILALQSPNRPWLISFTAELTTPLSPGQFAHTVRELEARRPELAATLTPDGRCWQPGGSILVDHSTGFDRPLPLDRGAIHIAQPQPDTIQLLVNHAFTDGLGASRILTDLLSVGGWTEPSARVDVSDQHLSRLRGKLEPASIITGVVMARHQVQRTRRLRFEATTHLASTSLPLEGIDSHRVGHQSRNDVVVTAVHRALSHVVESPRPTTVSVPVDLRRFIGEPTGLGNAVLNLTTRLVHVGRTFAADCDDVSQQIRRQRSPQRLGQRLDVSLRALRPGLPRSRVSRRARTAPTAVCSNLGSFSADGVHSIHFSPPAHDVLSFGVVRRNNTVDLTARARIDKRRLDDILEAVAAELN